MKKNPRRLNTFFTKVYESGDVAQKSGIRLSAILTFKSLGGGLYVCNQTGEKTKRPDRYRSQNSRIYLNEQEIVKTETTVKKVKFRPAMTRFRLRWEILTANCPYCKEEQDVKMANAKHRCMHCQKKFFVYSRW